MKLERERIRDALIVVAAVLVGVAVPALAHVGQHPSAVRGVAPPGAESGPEALSDARARRPVDRGVGEKVILVVGGVYASEPAAARAAEDFSFGDLQGYYVLPVAQFEGLREQLSDRGDWVVATGFRTERGAGEFLELAAAAGVPAFATERVRNLGPRYLGLGQESNPEGTGPQEGAIPGVTT